MTGNKKYKLTIIYVLNKLYNIIEMIEYKNYDVLVHKIIDDELIIKYATKNFNKIIKVIKSVSNYNNKFFHTSIKPFTYPIIDNEKNFNSFLGGSLYKNPIGIWLSCGYSWQKYISDYPSQWSLATYIYQIELSNTILHISSLSELKKFIIKYKFNDNKIKITNIINWKNVKKDYDGLVICPYLGNKIWGKNSTRFSISGSKDNISNYISNITGDKWKNDIYYTAEWYRHWEEATGVIWKPSTGITNIFLLKKLNTFDYL